jgi:glycolate oxidase
VRPEEIKQDLAAIVGESNVTDSIFERRLYDHDIAPLPSEISMIFKTVPDFVVRPKSVEEVSQIVEYANGNDIPVVPRGASTWGYGGTIPTNGGIVLALTDLKKIVDLDREGMTVTVEAGLRWKMLMEFLDERALVFNVYPSSAPSATIGGWLATGGLGIGSLKYGHLKEHVKEMRVVTPTGETLTLSNDEDPEFDSFIGSEGTLGVIVEVKLEVHPKPEKVLPELASFDDVETLVGVIERVVKRPTKPFFIEIQDGDYLEIKRSIGIHAPDAAVLALFVYEGPTGQVQEDAEFLRGLVSEVGGSMLPPQNADEEWEERFYYMRIRKAGPTLLAGEVTHPLPELQNVLDDTRKIKEKHGLRMGVKCFMVSEDTVLYMPMYLADERERWKFMSLLPVVNEITAIGLKAGGGPYGFGIWNSFFLRDVFGDAKVREMKERKRRLDPNDIMNPGKLYQVKTRYGVPLWGSVFRIFTSLLGILKYF